MTAAAIEIHPLNPVIGAEIRGVDLGQPLGNQLFQEIHDALLRHLVIFFRDQELTPAQHAEFSRRFGQLHIHPFYPGLGGLPEVMVLEADETYRLANDIWHSDVSFAERPPMGSVLLARQVPDSGGDTMWANMYAAYEALSDRMQNFLSGLTAVHDYAYGFAPDQLRDQRKAAEDLAKARSQYPPVEHPVIRTHPVTGRKALYVNCCFTSHIAGMTKPESRALLGFLYEHLAKPEFTCRHRWRANDVAFWDNRVTQHYALNDYFPARRVMHRTTIVGEKPA
jgi:taurine dioxygenase